MGVAKFKDPATGKFIKQKVSYIEKVHVGAEEPTDPNCNVWIKEVDETSDEYMPSKGEVETMISEAVAVYDADGDGIVDDAKKLGGKSADEYQTYAVKTFSVATQEELDAVINQLVYFFGTGIYHFRLAVNADGSSMSNGIWFITKYCYSATRQIMKAYHYGGYGGEVIELTRSCFNGSSWSDWKRTSYVENTSNPNLLINGDFRVNQRNGYIVPIGTLCYTGSDLSGTSGTTSMAYNGSLYNSNVVVYKDKNSNTWYTSVDNCIKGYVVDKTSGSMNIWDCWFGQYHSLSYSSIFSKIDNIIRVETTKQYQLLGQKIEDYEKLLGKTVTLSCKVSNLVGTWQLVIYTSGNNGVVQLKEGVNTLTHTIKDNATLLQVYIQNTTTDGTTASIDIDTDFGIKLELGNVATPFTPQKTSNALSECQPYLWLNDKDKLRWLPAYIDSNNMTYYVPIPTYMRAKPSLIGTPNSNEDGCYYIYDTTGQKMLTGFTFQINGFANGYVIVSASKASHGMTLSNIPALIFNKGTGFSAEL